VRPGELGLEHDAQGSRHTLHVRGELDLLTAPELEAAISEIAAAQASEIVLDLSELAFIDSTGLRSILISRQLCEDHGCELRLARAQDQVKRLFELTGLLEMLQAPEGQLEGPSTPGSGPLGRSPEADAPGGSGASPEEPAH
jgi:anti-sigma B factor antagonist